MNWLGSQTIGAGRCGGQSDKVRAFKQAIVMMMMMILALIVCTWKSAAFPTCSLEHIGPKKCLSSSRSSWCQTAPILVSSGNLFEIFIPRHSTRSKSLQHDECHSRQFKAMNLTHATIKKTQLKLLENVTKGLKATSCTAVSCAPDNIGKNLKPWQISFLNRAENTYLTCRAYLCLQNAFFFLW